MEKHWLKSYPPGVRAEINVNEYPSLKELIERGLAVHSVRDAYVQMGKAMTFGELDVLSAQFGAFLQSGCGLQKGDREGALRIATQGLARPTLKGDTDRARTELIADLVGPVRRLAGSAIGGASDAAAAAQAPQRLAREVFRGARLR